MHRYELTDEAWELVKDHMPPPGRPGGRWNDHRRTLNGIFWVLNSGAPWRDLPPRYGKWQSVYHRCRRWSREGLFDRVLRTLQLRLDDQGRIDWSQFDADGSNIRADRAAAGARKKGGRSASRRSTPSDARPRKAGVGVRSLTW